MKIEQDNQRDNQNCHKLSVALVGSMSSGKTSLIQKIKTKEKFIQDQFRNTIGCKLYPLRYTINRQQYSVQIWDTQGFDRNWGILSIPHIQRSNGFIIMFDITSRASFQNVKQCLEQVFQKCRPQNQHVLLLANKSDKLRQNPEQQIDRSQIEALTQKFDNIQYKMISVKSLSPQKLEKILYQKIKILAAKIISDEEYQRNLSTRNEKIRLSTQQHQKKPKGCSDFISNIGKMIKKMITG